MNNDKDDWDEQLPHALLAYRVSKQSSTGVTPFEICMEEILVCP